MTNIAKTDNPSKNKTKTVLSTLLSIIKWLILFLVIYTFINWWRKPIMPDEGLNLTLTDYKGRIINLDKLSQKSPVLVYFWGTWCGVCSVSSPKVNSLYEQGYPVISIAVQSGTDQELHHYMQNKDYTFPVINDSESNLFDNWKGQVTPSYVILHKGKAVQGMTGIQPLWSMKLRVWVSSL